MEVMAEMEIIPFLILQHQLVAALAALMERQLVGMAALEAVGVVALAQARLAALEHQVKVTLAVLVIITMLAAAAVQERLGVMALEEFLAMVV